MVTNNKTVGNIMTDNKTANGWNEWSRHVLAELERLSDCYEKLEVKVDNGLRDVETKAENHKKELMAELEKLQLSMAAEKVDLAVLKVKAGLWGALAGTVPVLVVVIILIATGKVIVI